MTIVGVVLLYLGVLNAALSLGSGTCTGGSADELVGGLYSLALYLLGWLLIYFSNRKTISFLVFVPLIPVAWWQLHFVMTLGYGFFLANLGACTVLGHGDFTNGAAEGWFDGRETFFFFIWLAANLAFLLGAVASYFMPRTIRSS
ncbi:hypothetical protein [Allomesorhizobium camelthorni]|uniref:Uncharacterized protein n=1 Tax=Allomesorhizobium camelthorni TaxID=475069 RepID=A0A6G4WJI3_9HYPH|nr:hypothetical protein [Mesorhizobium camelthorni]NGO54774.1 hypothetical protein [Mesorhizobium camelthorni]